MKYWLLGLMLACGQQLNSQAGRGIASATEIRAGIGQNCVVDADCAYALTCTTAQSYPSHECNLRWVPFDMAPCPIGYVENMSETLKVGETEDLNHPNNPTGYWCLPSCNSPTECPNGQRCLGLPDGSGMCMR